MIKIERVYRLKDEKATETFMKRSGGYRSRHDENVVITDPMTNDVNDIIRFWAEEQGLLA